MSFWPMIECPGRRLGYARVSTKDQKLRMQRDALNTVECQHIFEDHGISGAKGSRPGLDALLAEMRAGDSVIVFKLDRLGRSVLHLADLLVRFQNEGIHFVSLSEGINTTTPGGKLVFHIFSAVAEFHRDIIVENTTAGIEAARKRGVTLGRPRALGIDAITEAHRMMVQDCLTPSEIARLFGVHRRTVTRALDRERLEAA